VGFKLKRTHQHLVSADDVNLLGDNINTIQTQKPEEVKVGLEVNTEKIKYMLTLITRIRDKIIT
jgi:hypothetical protein